MSNGGGGGGARAGGDVLWTLIDPCVCVLHTQEQHPFIRMRLYS